MKRWVKWGLIALGAIFLAMQLVPVSHSNPPVSSEVDAPEAARAVLRRSCYDCHSNQVRRPWYAYVAPSSWLVERDVSEGRRHLNFSAWDRYDERRRGRKLEEIGDEVEHGTMPLWYYLPLHPQARLSAEDREALRRWTSEAGAAQK